MVNKVAVAGATGNIGLPVIEQLLAAKFDVTVLSRSDKPSSLPAGVTVRKVDYDSVESLTAALQGQDAVVSTVGASALAGQKKIIDAAVAAGVQRFLPSEYGNDTTDPAIRALAVFVPKAEVQDYLKEVSAKSQLTYTILATGPFLDWGIQVPFLLGPLKERKAEIFDGGDVAFSSTTLAGVGKSVAAILRHLDETKNRVVFVQEALVTQNQLVRIAQELTPGEQWTVTQSRVAELKEKADAKLAKGEFDYDVAVWLIKYSIFGKGFAPAFKKLDNDVLGVKTLSDEELRAVVKSAL